MREQPVAGLAPSPRPLAARQRREIVRRVLAWYDVHARDLPWRASGTPAWHVLISEVMLQQTPVERVRGPYLEWTERWPTPTAMAAASTADVLRAWGRLGYPRRALRLHQAAQRMVEVHGGEVPDQPDELRALPGLGDYTVAAVLSFAYRQRAAVVDTNVRRVLARVADGVAYAPVNPSRRERELAEEFLPHRAERAARWAVASMEIGALICTARNPRCLDCPLQSLCRWHRAGHPAWEGPARRGQTYEGTDRQCRGAVLHLLRQAPGALTIWDLAPAWPDADQLDRAFASLQADGLVVVAGDVVRLPD